MYRTNPHTLRAIQRWAQLHVARSIDRSDFLSLRLPRFTSSANKLAIVFVAAFVATEAGEPQNGKD